MQNPYVYTALKDYIDNLTFDYIETYSFQRGEDFEDELRSIKPEYATLKVRKEKRNNLTQAEEARFSELHELLAFTQYLVNEKGEFHPSSRKKNTFQSEDPIVQRLRHILGKKTNYVPMYLCAPTYRDAIVFYKKERTIVSVLNVCLSCLYMETKKFNHLKADYETYDLLKTLFLEIGHEVENPEKSLLDELEHIKSLEAQHKLSISAPKQSLLNRLLRKFFFH